jgi:hypothetical protein
MFLIVPVNSSWREDEERQLFSYKTKEFVFKGFRWEKLNQWENQFEALGEFLVRFFGWDNVSYSAISGFPQIAIYKGSVDELECPVLV